MTVSSKVRIYDLAKELKLDTKRLIEEVRREGVDVSVPSNSVSKELAEKIRNKYFPKKETAVKRAVKVVKKRPCRQLQRARCGPEPETAEPEEVAAPVEAPVEPPVVAKPVAPRQPATPARLIKTHACGTCRITYGVVPEAEPEEPVIEAAVAEGLK